MSKQRLIALLLAIALVGLGAVVGAIGMRIYDLRSANEWFALPAVERRAELLERVLARRLDLTDAQKEKMAVLIESQRPAVIELHQVMVPLQLELRQEIVEKSAEFLEPSQLDKLRKFAERINEIDSRTR